MEPNRILTVHWKEHSQRLSKGLWNLFKEEYMVDTNLSFYGDAIKIHSLLLSIFIPIINDVSTDNTVKEVNLDYIANQKEDVLSLVEFIYTGRTKIAEDRIQYVRRLARDLEFKGLESSIEECERCATVDDYSCTIDDVEDDESSPNVKSSNNHLKALPRDSGSVECHVSFTKIDTSKPTSKRKMNKPVKRKCVQATKDESSSSELTVTRTLMTITRSQSAALKRNEKSTDDESTVPSNCSIKKDDDVATYTSEEDYSDESSSSEDRRRHRRKKRNSSNNRNNSMVPIKCNICKYETEDKRKLKRHIKEQHEFRTQKCDKCNKEFKSKSAFSHHKTTSCGQDCRFVCNYCGHRTVRQATLEQHLGAKHQVDLKGNPLEKNVKCTQCEFVCFAKHQLRFHTLRKHSGKKFECPQCEFATAIRSELKTHFSIRHLNERKYVCDMCGVSYQTSGALNSHISIKHKGMKLYKCGECGKEFTCRNSYKIHMSKHTGTEKFFICQVCGHNFNRRFNLGVHLKKQHGLKMENMKKDYAPRNLDATNEAENSSDNLTKEETVTEAELRNTDCVLAQLQ